MNTENAQHRNNKSVVVPKIPIMWRLFSRISMSKIAPLFVDVVNGKYVNLYTDKYGIEWLAYSKYGVRSRRN